MLGVVALVIVCSSHRRNLLWSLIRLLFWIKKHLESIISSAPNRWENRVSLFVEFQLCSVSCCFWMLDLASILDVDLSVNEENTLLLFELFLKISLHLWSLASFSFIVTVKRPCSPRFKVHFWSKPAIELLNRQLILQLYLSSRPSIDFLTFSVLLMKYGPLIKLKLRHYVWITISLLWKYDLLHNCRFSLLKFRILFSLLILVRFLLA